MESYSFYADQTIGDENKSDILFLVSVILLWGLGIFTLYISSSNFGLRLFSDSLYFVKRQLVSSFFGFLCFGLFCICGTGTIRRYLPLVVIGSFILCCLTIVPGIGITRNGAPRWIRIPFSTFQPSEAAKVAVILFLANLFDKQADVPVKEDRSYLPAVVGFLSFLFVIIVIQKDFSTALFMFGIGVILFIVTGAKILWLVPFSFLAIPACFIAITSEQYRINRLIAFLRPEQDIQGINYQSFSAHRAINAGGFWGQGIGSFLTKIDSIPEIQADYIFAGWVEAMGFVGVLIYFALLIFFAWRALKIAFACTDRFTAFVTFGFASLIVLQSVVNCAVVCGVIPSTGIPLPFFSSGGSSIIMTLAMCGFMYSASHITGDKNESAIIKGENLLYE
ncbi:MAG: putative lipid II flippase FtsW [Treponema sp.]|nr:putative lipid II flippase FtsW [Treponema sp.]